MRFRVSGVGLRNPSFQGYCIYHNMNDMSPASTGRAEFRKGPGPFGGFSRCEVGTVLRGLAWNASHVACNAL